MEGILRWKRQCHGRPSEYSQYSVLLLHLVTVVLALGIVEMPSRSSSSHTATAALDDQTLINEPNNPPDTSEHQSEDEEENRERSVSVHQSSVHGDQSPPSSIEPSIDGFEESPPSHRPRHHPQSRYHDEHERTSRRHWTEQPSEYHDHVHDRDYVRDRERGREQRHKKTMSTIRGILEAPKSQQGDSAEVELKR